MKISQTNNRRVHERFNLIEVEVTESEAIVVAATLLGQVAHKHGKLTNPPERIHLGDDNTGLTLYLENEVKCDTYDACDDCGELIEDCTCDHVCDECDLLYENCSCDYCLDCDETYDDCTCDIYNDDLDEEFVVETFTAMNAFDRARWLKSKG